MARIFLDANIVIDLAEERKIVNLEQFEANKLFISPISLHILTYIYKYKIPDPKLSQIYKQVSLVPFDTPITLNSLSGPTDDFEDNVQLHSAANAECDVFLTNDKKLLNLKFFGKTKIIQEFIS